MLHGPAQICQLLALQVHFQFDHPWMDLRRGAAEATDDSPLCSAQVRGYFLPHLDWQRREWVPQAGRHLHLCTPAMLSTDVRKAQHEQLPTNIIKSIVQWHRSNQDLHG